VPGRAGSKVVSRHIGGLGGAVPPLGPPLLMTAGGALGVRRNREDAVKLRIPLDSAVHGGTGWSVSQKLLSLPHVAHWLTLHVSGLVYVFPPPPPSYTFLPLSWLSTPFHSFSHNKNPNSSAAASFSTSHFPLPTTLVHRGCTTLHPQTLGGPHSLVVLLGILYHAATRGHFSSVRLHLKKPPHLRMEVPIKPQELGNE
jgi:hypothetical protein